MLAATDRLLIAQGPFAGDAQAKLLGGGPALLDDALGDGIGGQVGQQPLLLRGVQGQSG